MIQKNIAIDIGTSRIKVFLQGKGVVLSESCAIAHDSNTGEILAIGDSAYWMNEKTPSFIDVKNPINGGIISDYKSINNIVSYIIQKYSKGDMFRPNILICVPSSCTAVQKKTIIDIACLAGSGKVSIVEEPVASAYGCAADADRPYGTLVVDIGAGTTDIAVITMGSIAYSSTIMLGGDDIDDAIVQYIRYGKKVNIGKKTAESIKKQVSCAIPGAEEIEYSFNGKDVVTDMPAICSTTNVELAAAANPILRRIMEEIRKVIEQLPAQMYADICDSGMILSGGSARLMNIDKMFSEYFSIPVTVCHDAENAAIKGAGYLLKNISDFEDLGLTFKIRHQDRFVS